MKLSLIICVYNTSAELLEGCLDSIFSEAESERFEVIFIDDGSTVDYSETISKYPVKYRKIENRGHLGARLYGISVAEGDYVAFVDSDDTVSRNYHAPMLEIAEKSGADIVINGWAFHTDRTKRICLSDTSMKGKIDSSGDKNLLLFSAQRGKEHSYYVFWNKIYKRELLRNAVEELSATGIFKQRITFGEDALINFFCFKNAKKVKNVNSGLYFYRIHSAQTVTVTDKSKLKTQIDCMSRVLDTMSDCIGGNAHASEIEENINAWRALMSRSHFSAARAQGYKDLYGYIRERYRVGRLDMPTAQDGSAYAAAELLGDNFDAIDSALTELYYAKKPTSARYEKKSKFISRTVAFISETRGETVYSKSADFSVPRRKIKLRDRVIHHPAVSRIGLLLFKKGSRLRAFLKKHL